MTLRWNKSELHNLKRAAENFQRAIDKHGPLDGYVRSLNDTVNEIRAREDVTLRWRRR